MLISEIARFDRAGMIIRWRKRRRRRMVGRDGRAVTLSELWTNVATSSFRQIRERPQFRRRYRAVGITLCEPNVRKICRRVWAVAKITSYTNIAPIARDRRDTVRAIRKRRVRSTLPESLRFVGLSRHRAGDGAYSAHPPLSRSGEFSLSGEREMDTLFKRLNTTGVRERSTRIIKCRVRFRKRRAR